MLNHTVSLLNRFRRAEKGSVAITFTVALSGMLLMAGTAIDYTIIGATATWYVQVAVVVCGHCAGLALAHDRALELYAEPRRALRSQYWMLVVMIGFTGLALWLLSQANA